MISCIIPAYNEEKYIEDVIKAVKSCKLINEIIVVSDGSTDKTPEIAKNLNVNKVIELKKNIGKAGAILEGLKEAKGDIIVLVDADLRGLNAENLINLIKPVLENKADMTIGSGIKFVARKFSGLRAVKRNIFEHLDPNKTRKLEYNIENELNYIAKKTKAKVIYVKMKGVANVHKVKKYGIKEGVKRTLKMYSQLARYIFKKF